MSSKRNPVGLDERITLSPQEASDALGLSKPTLQRLIDSGELPSFLIGTRRLIIRSDLEELARKRRDKYTAAARGENAQMNDLAPIDSKADITLDRLQMQSRSLRYTGRPHDADVMLWCAERIAALEQAILKNVDISWEPWTSLFPQPRDRERNR